MNCVVIAVNKLFPNQDLTAFKDRKIGVSMGDIQRMIPDELSVWPVYVNHRKCLNFDLIRQLPKTEHYIPLFLFKSLMSDRFRLHCELAFWDRDNIIVDDVEHDADDFFEHHKIVQVAALIKFETHEILIARK